MIATVMTSKYVDGTPLYRMEDALGRANIPVGRGTLGHWVIERVPQAHGKEVRGEQTDCVQAA
jgi:hypothetical protein